jgi:hypothetical protein
MVAIKKPKTFSVASMRFSSCFALNRFAQPNTTWSMSRTNERIAMAPLSVHRARVAHVSGANDLASRGRAYRPGEVARPTIVLGLLGHRRGRSGTECQPVTHFEIFAADPRAAGRVLLQVVGWKIETDPGIDCFVIDTGTDGPPASAAA